MSLVSRTIDGMFNGVSQQPAVTRLDSQCEVQENIYATILNGVCPRCPSEFVSKLTSTNLDSNSYVYKIHRDDTEKYIVIFTSSSTEPLEVYTLDGTKCTVTFNTASYGYTETYGGTLITPSSNTKVYVTSTSPKDEIKAVSVADYTFILNTTKTPVARYLPVTPNVPKALAYVKKGVSTTDYKIYVNSTLVASYTSTDSASTYKTTTIASDLYNDCVTALGTTNWTITLLDSTVVIYRKDGADFTFSCADSYGDQALQAIKGSVQKFTDLPVRAPSNYFCEIAGDGSSSFDNYYVYYSSDGVWKETVAEGLKNLIDPLYMPCALIRTGVNTFQVDYLEWNERKIGDEVSAPTPSFIGNTINDIFFYKNRLGFLSNDSIIMSRAGDYYNFFPATATDVLDDDPIDIAVSTNQVNILKNALPGYNTQLLVDSGNQQFIVTSGDNLFTAQSVSVEPATSYQTDTDCRPVSAGTCAYFASTVGNYTNIREYFLQPNTLVNDANNITSHVPYYLPKELSRLESSSSLDIILAFSPNERNNLYVYKYYWNGQEKAQSSWSKWIFDDDIYGIAIFDSYLYMLQKKGTETYITKASLSKCVSGDLDFKVRLDKQATLTGVYSSTTGLTTWTLPYTDSSTDFAVVKSTDGTQITGVTKASDTTLTATGDYSATSCYVGKLYTSKFRFSTFYVKNEDGGVTDLNYKLQLRKLIVAYADTGHFRLEVTPKGRDTISMEVNSSATSLSTDQEDFLVLTSNKDTAIDILSDSYLPFSIQSVTWQGVLSSLSSKI